MSEQEMVELYLARNKKVRKSMKSYDDSCHTIAKRVADCLEELQECVSDDFTTEQAPEQSDLGQVISDFLRGLSKEERMMFVRRYYYMDSIAEVAEHFGCNESKVKTMMFRCRKKLREKLHRSHAR